MIESAISKKIMQFINQKNDVRVFRNNVGVAYQGHVVSGKALSSVRAILCKMMIIKEYEDVMILVRPRRIKYGLRVGSGDWIGIRRVKITPDMVGQEIGQFISLEIKTNRGRESKFQIVWKKFINSWCGLAFVARSVEDVEEVLGGGVK